ncbi:MAG TPA: hypothetical protein VHO90_05735 [Bacteroidales bacterium]|nr:hypothetical protein [Bacteroidales bacterium]
MKTWNPLINPFLNATRKNYLATLGISTYHDSALSAVKSDPFFSALYNYYHPIHMAFKAAYNDWVEQGGKQQSGTLTLRKLLRQLSNTKIKEWDVVIQSHYSLGTATYTRLLPGRRSPFQNGKYLERIQAVQVLNNAIGTDEALATVKLDVNTFNDLLQAALTAKNENKKTKKNDTAVVENARAAVCDAQWGDLGGMIQKYCSTPTMIEQYFDVVAIRRKQQTEFTGHVKAGSVYTILRHTFNSTDQLDLINPGTVPLKFYLTLWKDMQPGTKFVIVEQGIKTILASELGDLEHTCLTVQNTNPSLDAEFKVKLV